MNRIMQHSSVDSFRTGACDFTYRSRLPRLETSVDALRQWYSGLDSDLEAAVAALSDDDHATCQIDRGGWSVSPQMQLHVYNEALLIFYGKVSVYLKAMGRERPKQWRDWIA